MKTTDENHQKTALAAVARLGLLRLGLVSMTTCSGGGLWSVPGAAVCGSGW